MTLAGYSIDFSLRGSVNEVIQFVREGEKMPHCFVQRGNRIGYELL
jgi:hypothetical protein